MGKGGCVVGPEDDIADGASEIDESQETGESGALVDGNSAGAIEC